jgi:hypothetical protein
MKELLPKIILSKDMRKFKPDKPVAIAYMKHLKMRQGKYYYQGAIFTGMAFESKSNKKVDAKVIQNGMVIGDYRPEIFASVNYNQQVDFSLEMPYEDTDPRKPEQMLCYQGAPYTGIAYYFKNNSEAHLESFESVLLLEGKEASGLGWNVWGELGVFWYRGHLSSNFGIGSDYITYYLYWDFRERYLYCEPFAPEDHDAITDEDVTGAMIHIYDKKITNIKDRRVKFSVEFQRNITGELLWLSIHGDINSEIELTHETVPYWPFQNLDDLFAKCEASESFYLGESAINDAVFRRVAQSGLLNSVKCLHIKSLITIKSEGLLLALPFLTELTLVGDREVQFLAQSFQSKKPNVKVTAVNG